MHRPLSNAYIERDSEANIQDILKTNMGDPHAKYYVIYLNNRGQVMESDEFAIAGFDDRRVRLKSLSTSLSLPYNQLLRVHVE